MSPSPRNRVLAWFGTISFLIVLVLLVWLLPIVAAVVFVACVTFVAATAGKAQGFWKGVKLFVKEMLFGW